MKKSIIKDAMIGVLLVLILCACNIPILPGFNTMMIYSSLVIVFAVFAFFMWHEKSEDEREMQHRAFSSRMAFTFGSIVLVFAIVQQGLTTYEVNPWISGALAAMIIGKVGGRIWAHFRY